MAHGNWEDYLDECAGRIGHTLLRFALGLPQLDGGVGAAPDVVNADWDEELLDEAELGLEGDDADYIAQSDTAPIMARLPSLADQPGYIRNRYRNWATKLSDLSAMLSAPERLLALRLVLWTAAAGAWETDDQAELAVIGKATEALAAPPEAPVEIEPETASLAAVALSILRAQAPRTATLEPTRIFNRAAAAVARSSAGAPPSVRGGIHQGSRRGLRASGRFGRGG